jgi:hypothetical protein
MGRGEVGEVELGPEVRGQPQPSREDRQRESGDDLARAQRDREECVDQRHRRASRGGGEDRDRENDLGASVDALGRPEADRSAEQHHPLDAEVEHARPLREQLAERRVEERRPIEDRLGQDDDEEAVVHEAASGAVPPSACLTRRLMVNR